MVTPLSFSQRETNLNKKTITENIRKGLIPAVLFGKNVQSIPIFINARETDLSHLHRGSIFSVSVNSKSFMATCKEIQKDPLGKFTQHISFMLVAHGEAIVSDIPLVLVGKAKGEKEGGVVQQVMDTLTVKATPNKMPEHIEVNIDELELNSTMTIAQISLPADVKLAEDNIAAAFVSCKLPKMEVVETPVEESEAEAPAAGDEEPVIERKAG